MFGVTTRRLSLNQMLVKGKLRLAGSWKGNILEKANRLDNDFDRR